MSPGVIPTHYSIPSRSFVPSLSASLGPGNPEGRRKKASNRMSKMSTAYEEEEEEEEGKAADG